MEMYLNKILLIYSDRRSTDKKLSNESSSTSEGEESDIHITCSDESSDSDTYYLHLNQRR